ncbi:hypothetical protein [Deinococcus sonorensis]|uniref:Uncharacterized protein n=2 Tax=Deinococcus sonorensis TaxID=309891 RepID=A0AAU7U5U6_9DEIO
MNGKALWRSEESGPGGGRARRTLLGRRSGPARWGTAASVTVLPDAHVGHRPLETLPARTG